MVDDLLEISRFDAGSAELSLDEVDPGELVRRAVAASAPLGEDGTPDGRSSRWRSARRSRDSACGWTNAGSSGSWPTCSRTPPLYAGGVTRVVVERNPHGCRDRPGDPESIRVVVEDHGPGYPPPRAPPPLRALLPGQPGRPAGVERRHRARACPWWPSTSGSTAASVWIEDAPGGGSRFIVELPLARTTRGRSACRDPAARSRRIAGRAGPVRDRGGAPPAACGIPTGRPRRPSPRPTSPSICSARSPRPRAPPACPAERRRTRDRSSWSPPTRHVVRVTRDVAVPRPRATLTEVLGALLEGPTADRVGGRPPELPHRDEDPGVGHRGQRHRHRQLHRQPGPGGRGPTRPWPSPRWCSPPPSSPA